MTMANTERDNARKAILNIKEPFCISDLFTYMGQIGFSNRRMVLQLLNELFEDGLIDYVRINKPTAEFAFIVKA